MAKREVLRQYFGHTSFRPGQEALIDGILAGRDALGIMPTGGGKSLCYQVPALLLPGLTLVVSPLISLMKDQVAALNGVGIPAAFLNSALDAQAFQAVCREIRQGMHKLIYVAPERLLQEGFLALMQEQKIAQVAVDEAHCISQWGQDFRPSYRKITEFVARLPRRPVLSAFTATATAEVQADILTQLELRDPVKVVTGFDRPNLYFAVQQPKRKQPVLTALVETRRDRSGIVYCATRSGVEKICDLLCQRGIPATRYHAGLSEEERQRNQDDFQFDRKTVMVATNAFGMGIDKSNVSFVIHYNMPKSLEAYYQEAGRAGRDGEAAECILLYGPGDVATAQFFLQQAGENEDLSPEERAEVQARDARRLEAMVNYCKTTHCLRGHLLDYFGQAHDPTCGNCGNCRSQFVQVDITRQAQMILSCVKRVQGKLGYYVGADLLSKVLRGSRSQRVLTLGLDGLTTYGLLRDTPLSGGAGGGGVSGYRACSQDPPAHPPGGGGPFPGEQGILNSAGGAGGVPPQGRGTGAAGTAAGGPGTDGGAEGHPAPAGPAGGGPFVRDFFQCHVGGHGPPPAADHGGIPVSVRCGRGQGPEVWRGLSGGFGPGGEGGGMTA